MQNINDDIEILNKLEITIFDFYYNFSELIEKNFHPNLYIISNEKNCLYVGISKSNVWNRWFSTNSPHIYNYPKGKWTGESTIGQIVVNNQPMSLNWKIDLREYNLRLLEDIEKKLINVYKPLYNVTHRKNFTELEQNEIKREYINQISDRTWDAIERLHESIFS